jgi:hypothetical protein
MFFACECLSPLLMGEGCRNDPSPQARIVSKTSCRPISEIATRVERLLLPWPEVAGTLGDIEVDIARVVRRFDG